MRVDIIRNKGKKMLRRICHEGEIYVQAPKKGSYSIRLYNHSNRRRMAVVTVDGVNVVNGEDGNFEGPGYVMEAGETLNIPGWRRDDGKVAAFLFRPEQKSYANQTGRGTKNVGVIGVAVFDEKAARPSIKCPPTKIVEEHHHHHHNGWPPYYPYYPSVRLDITCDTVSGDSVQLSSTMGTDSLDFETNTSGGVLPAESSSEVTCSTSGASRSATKRTVVRRRRRKGVSTPDDALYAAEPNDGIDVGTGYGHEVRFQTVSTVFNRATEQPAEIISLRYATRERLESWGVPLDQYECDLGPAEPFPASAVSGSCPAPPGWNG